MAAASNTIRVNRAPVLTLWAAVVAERLGLPWASALSLASAVAGTAAHAKAKRLGIAEDREKGHHEPHAGASHPKKVVRLLGRDIPVVDGDDGAPLAAGPDGKPAPAKPVETYVQRAFGERLQDVRAAMDDLATQFEPEELNRIGFRLYEGFRPEVPEGVKGWGTKGELHLQRIMAASES